MKLVIVKDYDAMSLAAANEIIMAVQTNPYLRLGLATGGTPEGMYRELVHASKVKNLDWSNVVTFNLDEYVGIDRHHPLSYATYMHEKFFDHVNLKRKNVVLPKGTGNSERNIAKFNKALEKNGGVDLQILGIGENAHIAFNEPGSSKEDGVRVVELAPSTIEANARYFTSANDVPRTAITMGIGTILKARRIILLASGEKKAEAIRKTWESAVSNEVPSSFLQLHNDVTFIIDEAAASLLQKPSAKPKVAAASEAPVTPKPKVTKPVAPKAETKVVLAPTPVAKPLATPAPKKVATTKPKTVAPTKVVKTPTPKTKAASATVKQAAKPAVKAKATEVTKPASKVTKTPAKSEVVTKAKKTATKPETKLGARRK